MCKNILTVRQYDVYDSTRLPRLLGAVLQRQSSSPCDKPTPAVGCAWCSQSEMPSLLSPSPHSACVSAASQS